MSKLVAVETFDVVHVVLLLCVCGKGFIIAIVFVAYVIVIFIMYKSDVSVRCYGHAYLVSCCSEGKDDRLIRKGKGSN